MTTAPPMVRQALFIIRNCIGGALELEFNVIIIFHLKNDFQQFIENKINRKSKHSLIYRQYSNGWTKSFLIFIMQCNGIEVQLLFEVSQ